MEPHLSMIPSEVAKELVGASIVTVTEFPSVTVTSVMAELPLSWKVTVVAVEAPQGSVTVTTKETCSLT